MATLSNENIIERWFASIGGAENQGEELEREFVKKVESAGIPGLSLARKSLTADFSGFFKITRGGLSKPREFIEVTHEKLQGYVIYAGTRAYGKQLLASWYLVADEKKLPHWARMAGGMINMMKLDLFETEELSAFTTLVHSAFTEAAEEMMNGLHLDFSKVDTHTKGFLNLS